MPAWLLVSKVVGGVAFTIEFRCSRIASSTSAWASPVANVPTTSASQRIQFFICCSP